MTAFMVQGTDPGYRQSEWSQATHTRTGVPGLVAPRVKLPQSFIQTNAWETEIILLLISHSSLN